MLLKSRLCSSLLLLESLCLLFCYEELFSFPSIRCSYLCAKRDMPHALPLLLVLNLGFENVWLHGAFLLVFIPVPVVTVLITLDFNNLFNCLPSLYYLMEARENSCRFLVHSNWLPRWRCSVNIVEWIRVCNKVSIKSIVVFNFCDIIQIALTALNDFNLHFINYISLLHF